MAHPLLQPASTMSSYGPSLGLKSNGTEVELDGRVALPCSNELQELFSASGTRIEEWDARSRISTEKLGQKFAQRAKYGTALITRSRDSRSARTALLSGFGNMLRMTAGIPAIQWSTALIVKNTTPGACRTPDVDQDMLRPPALSPEARGQCAVLGFCFLGALAFAIDRSDRGCVSLAPQVEAGRDGRGGLGTGHQPKAAGYESCGSELSCTPDVR
ncbi:hypothetical protein LIA77_03203 [Sarocladium implicatum]|nr:hypothetical protein LIA77_03203 [Sarocladium implicatum]